MAELQSYQEKLREESARLAHEKDRIVEGRYMLRQSYQEMLLEMGTLIDTVGRAHARRRTGDVAAEDDPLSKSEAIQASLGTAFDSLKRQVNAMAPVFL